MRLIGNWGRGFLIVGGGRSGGGRGAVGGMGSEVGRRGGGDGGGRGWEEMVGMYDLGRYDEMDVGI